MRSGFASGSRRAPLLAGAALALLVPACGVLDVAPGDDFAVTVLGPSPIPATGKISVAVRAAVTGCQAFGAAVSAAAGSHPVDLVRRGDAWVADVPVDWVRGDDEACLRGADAMKTLRARLDVTCRDADRTASAEFELSYATADVVLDVHSGLTGSALRYLYPSDDPFRPYALSPSYLQDWAALSPLPVHGEVPFALDRESYLQDPLSRPRVVASDEAVFVTSGCWNRSLCPDLEVAPGVIARSELIWAESLGSADHWLATVPVHVTDTGVTASGELVVASWDLGASGSWPPSATVTRITPGIPPDAAAEIVGYFPGEQVMTRFSRAPDGRLAFVTWAYPASFPYDRPSAFLNVTDGYTVERTADVASGLPSCRPLLAPDASLLLVCDSLGPAGANAWVSLPTDHLYADDGEQGGATWGPAALALWDGVPLGDAPWRSGLVEAFDRLPPHARLFRYPVEPLPGSSSPAALHGAVAVGSHFVLTTNTGVRVLDLGGRVVAGSDPLPCRMSPSTVAIQARPEQAAVGVGDSVLVLDLSAL